MKKIIYRVCSACLILATLFLTGCGGSFFAEEELQIVSVEAVPTNEGYTRLIITYSDESDREPDIFAIPDGEKGKMGDKGTGIAKVYYEHDDNNHQTGLTIEFTDQSLSPVSFDIPDGRSVLNIHSYKDDTGNYIIFEYNDGTQSTPYLLPEGKTGKGITRFDCVQNEQDRSVTIDIEMNDGTKPIHLYIPPPADGRGVASMSAGESEDGSQYSIFVTYSDNTTDTLSFNRPAKWYNGTTKPTLADDVEGSKVGDYFFDTIHNNIYVKEESGWIEIVSFNVGKKHTVTFDVNDDHENQASLNIARNTFEVERGTYFVENGYGEIPIPVRPGYTFKGWYKQKIALEFSAPPPTMSPFTDLTPVFSDLTLYAIWEKNS